MFVWLITSKSYIRGSFPQNMNRVTLSYSPRLVRYWMMPKVSAYTYKKMPHPEQRSLAARKRRVEKWCLEHLDVVDGYADICLQHMKASGDGRISMSSAVVSRYLKDCGYDNLPFSAQDFIRYCKT